MKFKSTKKIVSIVLILSMICSLAACSDQSWIVQANGDVIPIGSYIYNLYVSDSQAKSKVDDSSASPLDQVINDSEDTDSEDTSSTEVTSDDNTSTEVTSDETSSETTDDSNVMYGNEWVQDQALGAVKDMVAVDCMMDELGVSLTDEETEEAQKQSASLWAYYAKTLQNLGVAQDSFVLASGMYLKKSEKLFDAIYDQGGTQAVSDEEVTNYLTQNYVDYEYFSKDFSNTNSSGSSVNLTDDQKNAAEAQFQDYANRINSGTSITDIANEYTASEKLDKSPLDTTPKNKNDLSLDDSVKSQFEQMDYNQAIAFRTDDAEYLLYKKDINTDTDQLTKGSDLRIKILKDLKQNDYDSLLVDYANTLDIQINFSAMNKYNPSFVEKESSEASSKAKSASSSTSGTSGTSGSTGATTTTTTN